MTDRQYALNARFVTQSLTGIQRYCYELTMRLQNARLLAPSPALEAYEGVQARVNVTGGYLGGHPWEQFVLPLAISRRQALFSPAGCGPLAHVNQVLTIHDLAPLENPEWYSRGFALWYSHLVPTLARRVRCIVTVSEFCKQRIVELLRVDERKVTVAWEGASSTFPPAPPMKCKRHSTASGFKSHTSCSLVRCQGGRIYLGFCWHGVESSIS